MIAVQRFSLAGLLMCVSLGCPREPAADTSLGTSPTSKSAVGAAAAVGTGGFTITNPSSARAYYHDFGHVLYGEKLKHTFALKNVEGRALTIRDMLPSCGCTLPRVSYVGADGERVLGSREKGRDLITIPAGATAEVEIAIDTTMVETPNIDKLSQVRLRCDSDTNPYLTLELHLVVVLAFRAVPAKLDLGETPISAGKSARVDVSVCVRGNGSRIRAIEAVNGTFTADLQESTIAGERVWIVTATAPPGLPLGPARGLVVLSTTTEDGTGNGATFTVPILAQVVPDFVVHPGVLQFANFDRAKGGRVDAELVALVPGTRVKVLSVRLEGESAGDLTLEVRPIEPDETGRATHHALSLITKPTLAAAAFNGLAVLELDDPHTPRITVPYAGTSR